MKRILHVLRRLDPGGIELWLRDLLKAGGLAGCRIEILVETKQPGKLEKEFLAAGARLHRWRTGHFLRLYDLLQPFHAVHAHAHFFSGAILAVAAAARVPVRIAHSHTVTAPPRPARRLYESAMRRLILRYATHRVAASRAAACSLFGATDDVAVFPCARPLPLLSEVCAEPHLLGHVGRLAPEKNHALLEKLLEAAPELRLLLCGEGPARERLARHPCIEFTDEPSEVFRRSSCFVFPSWQEGFGLAVVEAQAAGLPCLLSNRVPHEARLVPELIMELDPAAPATAWAEAARRQLAQPRLANARERVLAAGYSLQNSIDRLAEIYACA